MSPKRMKFEVVAVVNPDGTLTAVIAHWAVNPSDSVATDDLRRRFRSLVSELVFDEGVNGQADDGKSTTLSDMKGGTMRVERKAS